MAFAKVQQLSNTAAIGVTHVPGGVAIALA
jgi:hypothetical protein